MAMSNRHKAKVLIELSTDIREADQVVQEFLEKCLHTSEITFREKIAFLCGMFDVEIIGHEKDVLGALDYYSLLNAIILSKFC